MAEQKVHPRKPPPCPIFGTVSRMNLYLLPTIKDTLMDYQWIRMDLKTNPKKEPTVAEICDELAKKVKEIWTRASIPTVSEIRIIQLIKVHHEKYLKLIRYPKSKKNQSYEQKLTEFNEQCNTALFDIAACKCVDFSQCSCERLMKVPAAEQDFLLDQRSTRRMKIGPVDSKTTKILEKREKRRTEEQCRYDKYQTTCMSFAIHTVIQSTSSDPESSAKEDTNSNTLSSANEESDSTETFSSTAKLQNRD